MYDSMINLARWRGSTSGAFSAHIENDYFAVHNTVACGFKEKPERKSGSTDRRVQRARTSMDRMENGQSIRSDRVVERSHRRAGLVARGLLSAALLLGVSFGEAAF